jgi:hypothetical protein
MDYLTIGGEPVISISQAAKVAKVSRPAIFKAIKAGYMTRTLVAGLAFIKLTEFNSWILNDSAHQRGNPNFINIGIGS